MSDMNDSLANLFAGDITSDVRTPASVGRAPVGFVPDRVFIENCPACGGSGRWKGIRPCFKCNSRGKLTFKSSPESRAASRQAASVKRAKTAEENLVEFEKLNPEVVAWCKSNGTFDFAVSIFAFIVKNGYLTAGQMAAVQRCIDRNKARQANRVTVDIDVTLIQVAFDTAKSRDIKSPRLYLGEYKFTSAKDYSANAGGIYVATQTGEYMGKVLKGKLMPTGACTPEHRAAILKVAQDPGQEAKAFGFRSKRCSCCGKTLTKGISIDMGIGPICAEKYGFTTY